uniref:Uncharacterized protein n=1 Tax=Rhizophora mucronata TaxID=61149 RepID=A0A2P2LSR9_RHIMU
MTNLHRPFLTLPIYLFTFTLYL